MKINITCQHVNPTFVYAKDELMRCLTLMDKSLEFSEDGDVIALGICDGDAGVDSIKISVKNGTGTICGANECALLIASYRFLRELGCAWTCPGEGGEHIPRRAVTRELLNVSVDEAPSYKHRGICIEGAVSEEHVRQMIEFIPRVGMNSYFFQFFRPSVFFQRWYNHEGNTYIGEEEKRLLSAEEIDGIHERLAGEIARRGLYRHAVGHGWTCVPFGVEGEGWNKIPDEALPEGYIDITALLNGKRQSFGGVPLNTNLCYSNPAVQQRISDAVVDYIKENRTVDVLHLWLADGSNNNCECDGCKDTRPSDYYVQLLNLIDEKLTKEGLNTKIVFLIYVDLLWAPEKYTLKNPERFIIMFAPITRTYSKTIAESVSESKGALVKPYVRNRLEFPKSVAENLSYLDEWRKSFRGEGFIFDYHLMWDHTNDPGYMQISRTLFEDMKGLDKIGLDGMISCQLSRVSFPTGLPVYAMAKALWDKNADFDDVADEYFNIEFGEAAKDTQRYLSRLSELFDPVYLRDEKPARSAESCKGFSEIPLLIEKFKEEHPELSEDNESIAWKTLAIHAEAMKLLSKLLVRRALGEERTEVYKELSEFLGSKEEYINQRIDLWNYVTLFLDRLSKD